MQETNRGSDDIRSSIPGMDLAIERPHSQYGSAIFVTSGTIVNTTSQTDINNIEILRVDLNGISVTSVYKPPGERFSFNKPLTAVGDQLQVVIGDINSHSLTWGYATTNTDGELVEDWAENKILSLIHDPELRSSFNSGRWWRGYNPDITFATALPGAATRLWWNQYHAPNIDPFECKSMQLSPCKPYLSGDDSTRRRQTGSSTHISSMQPWRTIPPQPNYVTSSWTPWRKVARLNIPRVCRRNYVQVWHPSPSNWSRNTERNTETIP